MQCRHGGLLGLKHLLNTHPSILPAVLRSLEVAMGDGVDDVVGAAASALVPVAKHLSQETTGRLVTHLMEALKDLDDLSSSTTPVLQLLSTLIAQCPTSSYVGAIVTSIVPRLVPFLHHHSSSVRLSALQTFDTLTSGVSGGPHQVSPQLFLADHCSTLMQSLFERALLESHSKHLVLIEQV